MNIFTRYYKRLFARVMANFNTSYEREIAPRKRQLFANLSGTVLEIGAGTGPNLAYYPDHIQYIGLEPNPYMHPYLQEEAQKKHIQLQILEATAEKIPLEDGSVDAVISSLVLCSVHNLPQVLHEIQRVLKPGGSFLFVEHVAAPTGSKMQRAQNTLQPIWSLFADGCQPNRETGQAIKHAGFTTVEYDNFDMPLGLASPHIAGRAVK